jgi:hypothetical protein
MLIALISMTLRILHHAFLIFESFPQCWVLGLLRCYALSLSVRFATFRRSVLCLSSRVKQARMDCVQAHISWLDIQLTPVVLPGHCYETKVQSKGSTVNHRSRRILLKLKYINVHVSAQL